MESVAAAVRQLLAADPLLTYCLASGLMNVRAVARSIRPSVEARTGAPVRDVAAIVNAVLRYRDHPSTRAALANVREGAASARISATSGMVRAAYPLAEGTLRSLDSLRARGEPDAVFQLASAGGEATVVADRRYLTALRKLEPGDISEGEAVVTVSLDRGPLPPALVPTALALLARIGLSVPCWAATPRGLWVCVAEEDLATTVAAFRSLAASSEGPVDL